MLGPCSWARRAQCLEHLGSHFRIMLGTPRHVPDILVAEELLRDYVFIHLPPEQPGAKLALLLQMLHKLYALVSRALLRPLCRVAQTSGEGSRGGCRGRNRVGEVRAWQATRV